jgi:hypothetical protein
MSNERLMGFARFFMTEVPPEFFRMSASPMTALRMKVALDSGVEGCGATDLVGMMRLFLCINEEPNEGLPWHQEPSELLGIPAKPFYQLVLGRGDGYQLNLYRFDRLPPRIRHQIAAQVLTDALIYGYVPWQREIIVQAGSDAAKTIVQMIDGRP